MPDQKLSQDQIAAMAKNSGDMADSITDFIIANSPLPDAQKQALDKQQALCLQQANDYIIQSLTLQQAELDASGQDIKNALTEANQAIKNIKVADKVLQVVTSATVLGASLLTADYADVPSDLQALWANLQIKTKPDSGDSADSDSDSSTDSD